MKRLTRFLDRWLPPLVVMVVIFWWSSRSDLPGSQATLVWWDVVIKKMAHLVEYGILFFTLQRALNWKKPINRHAYTSSFLLVLLYALTDEMHQSFTPGRHPKITDIFVDEIGALLVYLKLKAFI